MRRQPLDRPENVLALAVAEVERIKVVLGRVTDSRGLVIATGTGSGDTTPPVEAGRHTLYGVKHTRSFRVTDGGGLDVDYEQGQIWIGGSFYSVGAGSLTLDDNTTNYVFINSAGAAAYNATGFPADGVPLAQVTTVAGDITALADRRSYLLPGAATIGSLHDADQIIDDDGDTSVEVEKNADEDIIRLTAATVAVAVIGVAGQWQLPVVGAGAGILLGGDVQMYRSAANTLYIPDSVSITGTLLVDVINELAGAAGVTIEGVTLEDGYAELAELGADPAQIANSVLLYAKDDGGVSALYYRQDDGTVVGPLGAGGDGAGSITKMQAHDIRP